MNTLLLFFALPIATIIISIALQKIFRNPFLVAAIIFAIFLVVTFIINDLNFLIATIVYTIISFITAFIVLIICKFLKNLNDNNNDDNNSNCNNGNSVNNVQTISNTQPSNLIGLTDGQDSYNYEEVNNQDINGRINVYPNTINKRGYNNRCYRGRRIF